ncbi:MAG: DUF4097 family beta strand repeat protein [Nitrososphaerota archaeon]|jgi:DUF4097 and DUF4098 domain-containing protein YvlB|nr:DUF4097 family beta strand repeat protein [Nitrososphaerota archaeon]MDG6943895.1 DUF4097 family beta strand repeat protein [Nitrososphaerota archaeon]
MRPVIAAVVVLSVIAVSLLGSFILPTYHPYSYDISGKRAINSTGINSINIGDTAGTVTVNSWNGSQILVSYVSTSYIASPQAPSVSASDGAVSINAPSPSLGFFSFGTPTVNINVAIPSSMTDQIDVRLVAGDILVHLNSAESVYLTTTTGNINVNVSYLPQATFDATTGNIQFWSRTTEDVYASVVTGDISANLEGPLLGNYVFKATTGNINVLIPANSSVSFSISSSAGGIGVTGIPYNTITNNNQQINGVAGSGMASLSESTTTGNAFLKANS